MGRVVARRREGFVHDVDIDGGHSLVIDEPRSEGGADAGPSPIRVLASSLAACTAITVEMYAGRKQWDVGAVEVVVTYESNDRGGTDAFDLTLCVPEALDSEQQERLLKIASKCPVHRALAAETPVAISDRIVCGTAPVEPEE